MSAWTNLAFWVAAYLVYRRLRQPEARQAAALNVTAYVTHPLLYLLVVELLVIGVASFCFHTFAQPWAALADVEQHRRVRPDVPLSSAPRRLPPAALPHAPRTRRVRPALRPRRPALQLLPRRVLAHAPGPRRPEHVDPLPAAPTPRACSSPPPASLPSPSPSPPSTACSAVGTPSAPTGSGTSATRPPSPSAPSPCSINSAPTARTPRLRHDPPHSRGVLAARSPAPPTSRRGAAPVELEARPRHRRGLARREVERQPDHDEREQQRRSAVGEERQRDPRDGSRPTVMPTLTVTCVISTPANPTQASRATGSRLRADTRAAPPRGACRAPASRARPSGPSG